MPEIAVINSYQGNDRYRVIFDTTISGGEQWSDLGFMKGNDRPHVACTRPEEFLIIIGSSKILDGTLFNSWQATEKDENSGKVVQKRKPCCRLPCDS